MSTIDGFFQQQLGPLLRPGENVMGHGMVHKVVPTLVRLSPILRSYYIGHRVLVATDQRLIFARVDVDLAGNPKPEIHAVETVELSELSRAEPFDAHTLGHTALRLVRKNGWEHPIMWRPSVANLAGHAQFVANFPNWLMHTLATGVAPVAPPPPDPRVAPLAPPPVAGTWALVVLAGLAVVFFLLSALGSLANGFALQAIPLLALAGGAGYGVHRGMQVIGRREAELRGVPFSPNATLTPAAAKKALVAALALFALASVAVAFKTYTWGSAYYTTGSDIAAMQAALDALPAASDPSHRQLLVTQYITLAQGIEDAIRANNDEAHALRSAIVFALLAAGFVAFAWTRMRRVAEVIR